MDEKTRAVIDKKTIFKTFIISYRIYYWFVIVRTKRNVKLVFV